MNNKKTIKSKLMFKKIFLAIAFQGSAMLFAQDGVLKITVADELNAGALEFANVMVESAGVIARTGITDAEGILVITNLAPGESNVKAIYTGYQKNMIEGVKIKNNETTYLDIKLSSENIIDEFTITDWKKPLIDPNTSIKKTFDYEDIQNSPYRSVEDFVAMSGGAMQTDQGMTPIFRGSRPESVMYIIDGQKVIGSHALPRSAIQQMSVMLGGIPAQYGDATGAFIEIETRSGLVNPHK